MKVLRRAAPRFYRVVCVPESSPLGTADQNAVNSRQT
jgi:hypothetical protein